MEIQLTFTNGVTRDINLQDYTIAFTDLKFIHKEDEEKTINLKELSIIGFKVPFIVQMVDAIVAACLVINEKYDHKILLTAIEEQ